jgi:hypothetical protein
MWPPPPTPRPTDDPWGPPLQPGRHDPGRGPDPYGDGRRPGRPGTTPYDPRGPRRRPASAGERPAPGRSGRDAEGGGFRSPVGLGAVVGIPGAVAFVAALVVLPWFTTAGQDVTLSDIRSAYDIAATDPASLPGSGGTTDSTLPEGELPTTDEVADVVEDEVRDAAAAAAAQAVDGGRARYLDLYANTLWLPVAAVVAVAATVSTLLAPRSAALSLLLGVRRLAGSLVVVVGLAHAAALWVVFTGDVAPSPATGVWIGVGGLVAVLGGCVIGPRR